MQWICFPSHQIECMCKIDKVSDVRWTWMDKGWQGYWHTQNPKLSRCTTFIQLQWTHQHEHIIPVQYSPIHQVYCLNTWITHNAYQPTSGIKLNIQATNHALQCAIDLIPQVEFIFIFIFKKFKTMGWVPINPMVQISNPH